MNKVNNIIFINLFFFITIIDESKLVKAEKEIVVQVNGKVRAKFNISADASDDTIYEEALKQENVVKFIDGQEIKKHFVIKNKMVNIVI